jgi:hypothetical protein
MTRRQSLLILAFVVTVFAAGWLMAPPTHRVNERSFYKIQEGMTLKDIERILGGAPGGTSFADATEPRLSRQNGNSAAAVDFKSWAGGDNVLTVGFDKNGKAVFKHLTSMHSETDE